MSNTPSNRPQSAVIEDRDEWESIPIFVREKQLRTDIFPVSHAALWDWVAKQTFPAPVALSSGVTAWKRSDLKAWADGMWTPESQGETT